MKQVYSDIIEFRGSHYEFGKKQGERLRDSIMMKNREKEWKRRRPKFLVDIKETKQAFETYAPQIWEELIGLQESLKWPMEKVLQNFSGYRLDYVRSGCSIFAGKDYFVRNYDYNPKTYDGRFVLFQPNDGGFATIAPSSRVTGRMDGMNEKGLVMGYNFMHRKKPGDGFVCNMIGRMVLENCKTTEEAITFLKEIPHRHSFSYTVFDNKEETFIVEATPRGVEVRQANICTNHFELLTDENRHHLADSHRRMEIMEQNQSETTQPIEAFHLLNDPEKGVFSKEYHNWSGTIHTSIYFPKQLRMGFALGTVEQADIFDFESWLIGKTINKSRIEGELDTDLPFAQMEEH